jgi:hypothetical protein
MSCRKALEPGVLAALFAPDAPPLDFSAAAWRRCGEHAPFVFQQSDLPVREQTRLRLLHDRAHLYIGIACALEQPAPAAGAVAHQGEHVELFLDPGNTRKACLQFAVNAAGATFSADHRQPESATTQKPWWAGWTARTRCSDTKWEALRYPPRRRPARCGA